MACHWHNNWVMPMTSCAARYKNIELNMLCNIRMDKQRIDLFNKINRELDNDGTMEKLMRKYGIR
jgi:hypothetical protein